jgi:hypothetical protein
MEYDIKITDKSAIEMLNKLRSDMPRVNTICLERLCLEIVKRSQKDYLTGGHPLNVRTGTLRRGMWYRIDSPAAGKAEVGNNIKYAIVHDSPNVSDRTIVPKRAKALFIPLTEKGRRRGDKLKFGVDFVFSKKVIMPHRPFIQPAIDDVMKTNVANQIIEAALQAEFERLDNAQ